MAISLSEISSVDSRSVKKPERSIVIIVRNWLKKDIKIFSQKIGDKKKESFYSELGVLLSSGIDMKTSLEIIVKEQRKEKDTKLYNSIYLDVISGENLSESLRKSGMFSPYEFYSLRIGEESGRINDVLKQLTKFYSNKVRLRRQLVGALTYPMLVVFTAIVSVYFMLGFIVPMFEDVFSRVQGELPGITKFIIRLSESASDNLGVIFLLIIIVLGTMFFIRKMDWFRKIKSFLLLRIPVVGEMIKKVYLARFCQSMSLLISARTPILTSIRLVRKMINFYPYEKALIQIEDEIIRGKFLYQGMEKFQIFDSRIISLTKVAEQVNQLDSIYGRLNEQYTEELEYKTKSLTNILEPVMIILVGSLVAFILISMYLPLFQLSTSIF